MDATDLLRELYGRLPHLVHQATEGLAPEQLVAQVGPGSNPVGWLVWHLARVEDSHVAEVLDQPQVWVGGDWAGRFGLDPDPGNIGFGHGPDDVAAVRPESAEALVTYHQAVAARTDAFLAGLDPGELDRVVDEGWDPPVTLGARLVSVAEDELQHVGQAAYVRGLLG